MKQGSKDRISLCPGLYTCETHLGKPFHSGNVFLSILKGLTSSSLKKSALSTYVYLVLTYKINKQ